jgi:hypothetical protein
MGTSLLHEGNPVREFFNAVRARAPGRPGHDGQVRNPQ